MKPFEESLGSSPTLVGGQGKADTATLAEGAVLGNYRIIRLLGAGGMGAVYLVEHIHLKTRHALKTIRPEFAKQQNFAERFQREAKLAMRLKHPHIVACTEACTVDNMADLGSIGGIHGEGMRHAGRHDDENDGTPCLVMDYIEGPTGEPLNLRQLLDQRRERGELLDEDEATAVGLEICKALEYAHSYRDAEIPNGIIHRDLKPANILLDKDTNLYIADFGLARVIGEQFEASVMRSHALSRSLGEQATLGRQASVSTDAVGTFDYMSPEQREGRIADARSDVFAMGVILYELLTGRKVVGVPAPPSSVRPSLSPKWDEIILERALAYEPEERYASAGELAQALEQAHPPRVDKNPRIGAPAVPVTSLVTAEKPHFTTQRPALGKSRKRTVVWLVLGMAAIAMVFLVYLSDTLRHENERAQAKAAYIEVQAQFEESLMPDEALLEAHGGAKWSVVQEQMRLGRASEKDPAVGRQAYVAAQVALPAAIVEAREREKQAKGNTALAATRTARDEPQPGESMTVNLGGGVKMEFAWIPPGEFLMGSPATEEGHAGAEEPLHKVTVSRGFWMGKTEVTQRQYEQLVGDNPSYFKGGDLPVEQIDWNQAVAFCEKLQVQLPAELRSRKVCLPTEAEWEYACRAGSKGAYAGELDRMGWYDQNSGNTTYPVGQKQSNAWGLYDMHGNVCEWCRDDGRRYTTNAVTDPEGTDYDRVARGGGWHTNAQKCRSAYRDFNLAGNQSNDRGFRVVLETPVAQSVLTEQPIFTAPGSVPSSPSTKVFDLAADWSDTVNPNGCWTYLLNGKPAKSGVRSSDPFAPPGAPPIWGVNRSFAGWSKSRGTELAKLDLQKGDVYAHTGTVAFRWTSPVSGIIDISGGVWALRDLGRSTEWRLFLNGTVMTSGVINGRAHTRSQPAKLQLQQSVNIGDVIEFSADKHNGSLGDYLGINFKISSKI